MGGRHRFAMRHRGGFGQRMFGEQGYITLEQMRDRALQRFDRMDANHDGTVTVEERRQARAQMRERMRQRFNQDGQAPSQPR
jgi:hypothetical protein